MTFFTKRLLLTGASLVFFGFSNANAIVPSPDNIANNYPAVEFWVSKSNDEFASGFFTDFARLMEAHDKEAKVVNVKRKENLLKDEDFKTLLITYKTVLEGYKISLEGYEKASKTKDEKAIAEAGRAKVSNISLLRIQYGKIEDYYKSH